MNAVSQGTRDAFPPLEPPRVPTSKRTKWIVVFLAVVACGIPTSLFYWVHQYYRIYTIISSSMEPTIRPGDYVLADMHYFQNRLPEYGEIALVQRNKILIVKRVAALPGDTIEGRNGVIYLNGRALSEPYIEHTAEYDRFQNFGPITIETGQCFVMGDNRDNSFDSRHPDFGPIDLTTIAGRPLYILGSQKGNRAWERIK